MAIVCFVPVVVGLCLVKDTYLSWLGNVGGMLFAIVAPVAVLTCLYLYVARFRCPACGKRIYPAIRLSKANKCAYCDSNGSSESMPEKWSVIYSFVVSVFLPSMVGIEMSPAWNRMLSDQIWPLAIGKYAWSAPLVLTEIYVMVWGIREFIACRRRPRPNEFQLIPRLMTSVLALTISLLVILIWSIVTVGRLRGTV
jgi:hypothetical protein